MVSFSFIASEFFTVFVLFGMLFLISGWLMKKHPPKGRNALYGYRTPASMKSQARWDFAQGLAASSLMRLGGIHLAIACLSALIPVPTKWAIAMGVVFSLLLTAGMIALIESAIRKEFPED